MGKQITINNAQVNWPALINPQKSQKFPNNPPSYSCEIILDPNAHQASINELSAAFQEAAANLNGQAKLPPSWTTAADGKIHLRVRANESHPPQVVDEQVQRIFDANKIYAGCWCNFVVDVYGSPTYNTVSAGLLMVQFVQEGDRLDNRPQASEVFKPIATAQNTAAAPAFAPPAQPATNDPTPFNPLA